MAVREEAGDAVMVIVEVADGEVVLVGVGVIVGEVV